MNRWFIGGLVLALAGCSSSTKQKLVIYSPHGKEMLAEFERQYEEVHPDVDVQWLDMGSQDAYDRIRTERENPQADVWWGSPSTIFAKAEAESLLERFVPSWSGAVAPDQKSSRDMWYATFITPEVIMYNTHALTTEQSPKDWDDLLDARWKDKIIIRDPFGSGGMRVIFGAIIQREARLHGSVDAGFEWLLRLDANTKTYVPDPTQLYLKIAREEGLVTLWNLPDVILQSRKNGYPFGYVIPRSGTPLIVDCIAIIKGSRHRTEAERFYEFVTSRKALVQQAQEFGRLPARTDVPASLLPEWMTALNLNPMEVDWQGMLAHEKEWMKRWGEQVKGRGRK